MRGKKPPDAVAVCPTVLPQPKRLPFASRAAQHNACLVGLRGLSGFDQQVGSPSLNYEPFLVTYPILRGLCGGVRLTRPR
jgi:hypothetical protein